MATEYRIEAIITPTEIRVEFRDVFADTCEVFFREPRPATLAEADTALAAYGLARVQGWDLGHGTGDVRARVNMIDNKFKGVRAARLDAKIGTTHDEVTMVTAREVQNGDLITDRDQCALYVVSASAREMGKVRISMVGEGQSWADRYATWWPEDAPVWVARRKA